MLHRRISAYTRDGYSSTLGAPCGSVTTATSTRRVSRLWQSPLQLLRSKAIGFDGDFLSRLVVVDACCTLTGTKWLSTGGTYSRPSRSHENYLHPSPSTHCLGCRKVEAALRHSPRDAESDPQRLGVLGHEDLQVLGIAVLDTSLFTCFLAIINGSSRSFLKDETSMKVAVRSQATLTCELQVAVSPTCKQTRCQGPPRQTE